MQVRESTDADVAALERAIPTGAARVHAAHRARAAAGELTHLVVVDDEGVPLGVGAVLWSGPRGENAATAFPGVPELAHVHVAEHARGRGAGSALLAHAEAVVRGRGHRACVVGVSDDNDGAIRLYQRRGYRDTAAGDTVDYTWVAPDGAEHAVREDCLLLLKRLDGPDAG